MKAVLQRVESARVLVDGETVGCIGHGALVLLGISKNDTQADLDYLVRKVSGLRVYDDEDGRLNAPIRDAGGGFLVVSQFTLYGDCRKGNRPSYIEAADPETGRTMYETFVKKLADQGFQVETGQFQAQMKVELVNDGPVTIILESTGRGSE